MIELQNICFEYGSEEQNIAGRGALHNINLHIPDGQIVLLCGESGCGKTTITRLLNGLIPHFYEGNLTGTICIDGKEINDQPLYETALLSGTVFQNPRSQFFNVDTTSELAFGLENRGINGIEVIKAFGKAQSSYEKFEVAAKEGADCYVEWMRRCNVPFCIAMVVMPCTALATVPIGGFLFMKGSLSLSTLVMCLILSMGLVTPLITVMSYSDDIGKMGSILGEVTGVLSWEEQLRPINDNKQIKDYSICLENVRFSYREKEVLHGVNLKIESGTVNALVGPSGSGKSTIAKLIASLWDVDSGSIKIGGVDISELSLKNYNRKIAYVSQDNYLFDNTIRENIRMGDLNATDKQVEQAAKDCGCHEFIMALPDGYDTIVGSAGGHLSGGERQRISIARAMLKNAPIIILDEATAYTDPENEALIQHSVAKLIKGKTLIVIAHRLSTIVDADQIFVIENGTVAETGTHNELLANGEIYSNMWRAHMSVKDSEQEVEPRA